MMWHDGWGAGSWILMGFMMLMFWALVIGGVVWLIRGTRGPFGPPADRTRQILDERFARGEIAEDEYRQRRDMLNTR
jgi:putative membrane protein